MRVNPGTLLNKGKFAANAFLSFQTFRDGDAKKKTYAHALWVTNVTQSHTLAGSDFQSKHTRHFYGRSFAPGDLALTGICSSQKDYQDLALFIRYHHEWLTSDPGLRFDMKKGKNAGFNKLMYLIIPSEVIAVRGWVVTNSINKRGVFEQAPQFQFNFFTGFDGRSTDPQISQDIVRWWNPNDYQPNFTKPTTNQGPTVN